MGSLLFGVVTLVGRLVAPDSAMFSKLEPLKRQFGETAGTVMHVAWYTVIPLALGLALIGLSLLGG